MTINFNAVVDLYILGENIEYQVLSPDHVIYINVVKFIELNYVDPKKSHMEMHTIKIHAVSKQETTLLLKFKLLLWHNFPPYYPMKGTSL